MTMLSSLFRPDDLDAAITAGHVRAQDHPSLPLRILNYTEACANLRAWTDVTRQCRGLIVRTATGEVVARPYRKFLNHDEHGAYAGRPDEPVVVTDKLDGSLGIGYPTGDGGFAVATRGSFGSEQAVHATALWQARYAGTASVPAGLTPLFEIINPDNRVVVFYDDLDDLVLLGGVDIASGRSVGVQDTAAAIGWPGPVVESFPYATLTEAMAAPARANREGVVVYFPESDERVKVKYERYLELHRVILGMNERVVWEHLGAGRPLDELLQPLPEEFRPWVQSIADQLVAAAADLAARAAAEHAAALATLGAEPGRREYALHVRDSPVKAFLFMLLDGRDPQERIWQSLRPSGRVTMMVDTTG
jgi:RNA ligase